MLSHSNDGQGYTSLCVGIVAHTLQFQQGGPQYPEFSPGIYGQHIPRCENCGLCQRVANTVETLPQSVSRIMGDRGLRCRKSGPLWLKMSNPSHTVSR